MATTSKDCTWIFETDENRIEYDTLTGSLAVYETYDTRDLKCLVRLEKRDLLDLVAWLNKIHKELDDEA